MDHTTRLLLNKPDPDPETGDFVDIQELNDNADKIDETISFTLCTSTARPSDPFPGQAILETDTGFAFVYGGSGYLPLAIGDRIGLGVAPDGNVARRLYAYGPPGSAVSQVLLRTSGSASGNRALSVMGGTDTQDHWWVDFDGNMQWGPGNAAADTNLYRGSGGSQLRTDDNFSANGYQVNGNTARVMTDFQLATCSTLFNPPASPAWGDVPGMTVTVTTRKANALCEMVWFCDYDTAAAGTGFLVISIPAVDNVDQSVNAIYEPGNVTSGRATIGNLHTITLPTAGTHTIKIRARMEIGAAGGIRINSTHSKLLVKVYE